MICGAHLAKLEVDLVIIRIWNIAVVRQPVRFMCVSEVRKPPARLSGCCDLDSVLVRMSLLHTFFLRLALPRRYCAYFNSATKKTTRSCPKVSIAPLSLSLPTRMHMSATVFAACMCLLEVILWCFFPSSLPVDRY